jgi:hypothetical protein
MATVYSSVSAPITLLEYAKTMDQDSPTRIFVENMAAESDLMASMPFLPAMNGKRAYMDIATVPQVGFRGLNTGGGEATGNFNLREEDTFFVDEYVKVDRAIMDRLGPDHEARQIKLKTTALAQMFTASFIKSDNDVNPTSPNGIQSRCNNLATNAGTGGNLLHNSVTAGGGALSLANLDILYWLVNKPTHWLMPRGLMPYLDASARDPQLTNNTVTYDMADPLGRRVMRYKGLPILFGYEPDDSPDMLPFSEVGAGGGAAQTASIYCVSLRDGGLYSIEQTPLTVRPEGQLIGAPFNSTHIKWDWGIAREHPRAVARLTSVTATKIAA